MARAMKQGSQLHAIGRVAVLTAAVAFSASAASEGAGGSGAAAVQSVFDAALHALRAGDGDGALGSLTPGSVQRLEHARQHALRSPRSALASLSPATRLLVLALRHEVDAPRLEQQPLASLLSQELERWGARIEWSRAALGPQIETADRVRAPLLIDGKPMGLLLEFRRAEGLWRADAGWSLVLADAMLTSTAWLRGKDVDEVLVELLGRASGRPVPVSIWLPLAPRNRDG